MLALTSVRVVSGSRAALVRWLLSGLNHFLTVVLTQTLLYRNGHRTLYVTGAVIGFSLISGLIPGTVLSHCSPARAQSLLASF